MHCGAQYVGAYTPQLHASCTHVYVHAHIHYFVSVIANFKLRVHTHAILVPVELMCHCSCYEPAAISTPLGGRGLRHGLKIRARICSSLPTLQSLPMSLQHHHNIILNNVLLQPSGQESRSRKSICGRPYSSIQVCNPFLLQVLTLLYFTPMTSTICWNMS